MIKVTRIALLLFSSMTWVSACGGPEDRLDVTSMASGLDTFNGVYLNGVYLNGVYLNGVYLNGVYLNGVYLNGAYLDSVHLDGVALAGVVLEGTHLRSKALPGSNLVGAIFEADLTDGTEVSLRIDAVAPSPTDPEVSIYQLSFATEGGAWTQFCGRDASGAPVGAIAVAGRWDQRSGIAGAGGHIDDPNAITFACRGAAIAKCVEAGYKPWKTFNRCTSTGCTPVSYASHHQACTRLIRADYCGDGTTHTVNGLVVNLYDAIGVQTDTEAWNVEAEWTEFGARCLTDARRVPTEPVACLDRIYYPGGPCGADVHFSTGTLLMDEIP